jgi:diacylglycerol kinase family enzyme
MLDVVALAHVSRRRFLSRVLPRLFKGTHVELPEVRVFRAAEVAISADRPFTMYADGDPVGELPLRVRAVRGAVNVIVPLEGDAAAAFAGPHPAGAGQGAGPVVGSQPDESPVTPR